MDVLFEDVKPIDITTLTDYIEDLPTRLINRLNQNEFYSEKSFFDYVNRLRLEYTSTMLFPNRYMSFYPIIKELRAKTSLTCNVSGSRIFSGSSYYIYSPFIEDLKNGKVYTIKKKLCVANDYVDLLPRDMVTYEEWNYKVKNAYYNFSDDVIDFYFLSAECGENCLEPYQLGPSKKKRVRI